MRVLYLTNAAQIGGGNRSLLVLWRAIRALGVEPFAVCPARGPMTDECARASVTVDVREYVQPDVRAPFATANATRAWTRLLREWKIDLIHANDPTNARSIAIAARLVGIPLLCHVHFPPSEGFFDWCFRFLPKPAAFAYCSRAVWKELEHAVTRACPSSLHQVIHNAVVLDDFADTSLQISTGRNRLRVGIVANLLPVKGHTDFLTMASILVQGGADLEFAIIGGDIHGTGYGDVLRDMAQSLGIADRVAFTGHVANIPAVIRDLDIVVCSSIVEPFGICVIETMAAGRPIVATNVGGIPEIVEDSQTGYLVPPHSPGQLADRVRRLVGDGPLRLRFGAAGRRRVEEFFSDAQQAARTLDLYREVQGDAGHQPGG
jgi:glycosyltransferase involved in cell wall biosynthesis